MAENPVAGGLLVIGGSAGALDALLRILPALRTDLPVPVIIILHRRQDADSTLSQVLNHYAALPVREAGDKDPLEAGIIYLAPAGYHLLVEKTGSLSLDSSEKIHYSRPAIDATFESAADAAGAGVTGILLSGANEDGTAGMKAIRRYGGTTIAQDPSEAGISYMPAHAIGTAQADLVLKSGEMAGYINALF